jgi:ATP-dependent RNA helicase DDX56/DBP9
MEIVTSTQRNAIPESIATFQDSKTVPQNVSRKRKRAADSGPSEQFKSRKRKTRKSGDKEYGATRGVDFIDVACVLNFDLPTSSRAYTHRVGRTARAGRTGMSLSFVVPADQWGKNKVVGCLDSAKNDEAVFAKIEKEQASRGSKIREYNFDMKQVEAFRYRMEDALRAVTRSAIKEARIKDLKTEILNSNKLKVSSLGIIS